MLLIRVLFLAALVAAAFPVARADGNLWPFWVDQTGGTPLDTEGWHAAGPLIFSDPDEARHVSGFRPLWVQFDRPAESAYEGHALYPLFSYRQAPGRLRWSLFSLVQYQRFEETYGTVRQLDAFPLYLSRQTGDPSTSYRASFPLYGTVLGRFSNDRVSWVLFPLYGRFEENNVTTTTVLWPIFKHLDGEGNRGWEVWPLFGFRSKEDTYRERYALWPLHFKYERRLWQEQPDTGWGLLPFYTRHANDEAVSETYLWPFFGYTDRRDGYYETRYFWPLMVQGQGPQRRVNRWAPFYTYSLNKGVESTWVAWPFFNRQQLIESGQRHTRTSLLYFLYRAHRQESVAHPQLKQARRVQVWPLGTYWDNGAHRRQLQILSPLEVFFPGNEVVQQAYSPLFAVYRYERDQEAAAHSFLFDLVVHRQSPEERELTIGPLLSYKRDGGSAQLSLFKGLIRRESSADGANWSFFWLDSDANLPENQETAN